MALLPIMNVNAETSIKDADISCTAKEGTTNEYSCTVKATTTGDAATDLDLEIVATNATVNQESITAAGDWTVDATAYPTLKFTSLGATGTYTLFTFDYTGKTDDPTAECKVTIKRGADTATHTDDKTEDTTPSENKQTGITLPYIILGGAAILAIAVYVGTRNKEKMYKI